MMAAPFSCMSLITVPVEFKCHVETLYRFICNAFRRSRSRVLEASLLQPIVNETPSNRAQLSSPQTSGEPSWLGSLPGVRDKRVNEAPVSQGSATSYRYVHMWVKYSVLNVLLYVWVHIYNRYD